MGPGGFARSVVGTLILAAAAALVGDAYLSSPVISAGAFSGSLSTGWHRHAFPSTHAPAPFDGVYASSSQFFAVAQAGGWVSSDGQQWQPAPGGALSYALKEHVPNLNLVHVGLAGGVRGDTISVKAEGPNGGYIAVGSSTPFGAPYTRTRGLIALSSNGGTWHTVSGRGKTFAGASVTDVARGGPGWVAAGFSWAPGPAPVIWTSTDATHWTRLARQPPSATNNEISILIHGPSGLLAVATGLDGPATVWSSADGLHWRHSTGNPFAGGIIRQVSVGGPGYLAVGQQGDDPALWESGDGVRWQRVAGAATFPGDLTSLQGVTSRGKRAVAVGLYETEKPKQYGWQQTPAAASSWTWTAGSSAARPTPAPRTSTIDPKRFRLRQSDLPAGFVEREFGGFSDFCDDGSTLCRSVFKTVGSYGSYVTSFAANTRAHPLAAIQSMTVEGSRSNPHALASLGMKLVRWWNRGGSLTLVTSKATIGQETRIYRGAPPALSSPPGGNLIAYAVEWRDGKAIGQAYVEQRKGPASAVEALALRLARTQWQHLRDAIS
jgi:hypothetical protein